MDTPIFYFSEKQLCAGTILPAMSRTKRRRLRDFPEPIRYGHKLVWKAEAIIDYLRTHFKMSDAEISARLASAAKATS